MKDWRITFSNNLYNNQKADKNLSKFLNLLHYLALLHHISNRLISSTKSKKFKTFATVLEIWKCSKVILVSILNRISWKRKWKGRNICRRIILRGWVSKRKSPRWTVILMTINRVINSSTISSRLMRIRNRSRNRKKINQSVKVDLSRKIMRWYSITKINYWRKLYHRLR